MYFFLFKVCVIIFNLIIKVVLVIFLYIGFFFVIINDWCLGEKLVLVIESFEFRSIEMYII